MTFNKVHFLIYNKVKYMIVKIKWHYTAFRKNSKEKKKIIKTNPLPHFFLFPSCHPQKYCIQLF